MITLHKTSSSDSRTDSFDIMLNNQKVGQCQLRHIPTKGSSMPEGFENHIYYEIDSEFQGKGYAKETLKLLLEEARKIELKEVVIVITEDNIPSQHVTESNGGILLEKKEKTDGSLHRKYKIIL